VACHTRNQRCWNGATAAAAAGVVAVLVSDCPSLHVTLLLSSAPIPTDQDPNFGSVV